MDSQESYDTPNSLADEVHFATVPSNHEPLSYSPMVKSDTPPLTGASIARQPSRTMYRNVTPRGGSLSSPPPTIANGVHRDVVLQTDYSKPTAHEMNEASRDDLLGMLRRVLADNDRLDSAAREARMAAAHFKLQHNLLSIETEETTKRMEVEHEMTRREMYLLQHATHERPETTSSEFIGKIRDYCQALEQENSTIQRRLKHARKLLEDREDEIEVLKERNNQFKQRIRENREHINTLRSPGGIFHSASPKITVHSYPATPQQYTRATPKQTPATDRPVRQQHSQEPFAALLLADRVLSQEHNSAPSTPTLNRRTQLPTTPITKHSRATAVMSSMPNTPYTVRSTTSHSGLLPSIQFTPNTSRSSKLGTPAKQSRERRRKSRDSTISASDDETYREHSHDVQESQASSNATQMLRADPRESFEVADSRNSTPVPISERSSLLQSKILSTVTKPVTEKRKRVSDAYRQDFTAKKARAGSSMGLGIEYTAGA